MGDGGESGAVVRTRADIGPSRAHVLALVLSRAPLLSLHPLYALASAPELSRALLLSRALWSSLVLAAGRRSFAF